jgi:hypothetical protein
MAMEVSTFPKRLARHALPIVMILAVGVGVSGILLSRYAAIDSNGGTDLAQGLVTQTVHLKSQQSGLAKVSFGYPPSGSPQFPAGATLNGDLGPVGQAAGLSMNPLNPGAQQGLSASWLIIRQVVQSLHL